MEDKNKKLNYQPNIDYVEDYYANYSDLKINSSVSINLEKQDNNTTNDIITNNIQPNIDYVEDYYANYSDLKIDNSVSINIDKPNNTTNDIITNNIQNNIDNLVSMIPLLPVQLQTVVNQVFKPIFNEWYTNLKNKEYPDYIPKDKPIITPYDPSGPGPVPKPEDDDPYRPDPIKPEDPHYSDPIIPPVPNPEPHDPYIYTPEPDDPIIGQPSDPEEPGISPGDDDDDIFAPSSPFIVTYPTIDNVEVIKMEYVKNIYDLYSYYTDKLQGVIGRFINGLFVAYMGTESDAQLAFLNNKITMSDVEGIDKDLKHIIDACLRSEIIGSNKISFCENMFSLESSLYHCKNFKASYELRLRYAEIEKQKGFDKYSSDSNTILRGMENIYDKKYDNAYINLYKYLNSSTQVLEDSFNTLIDGLLSKNTLIKKGGYNK